MSFGFKKLVIYGLLLIFLSFSFCSCFDAPEVIDEPFYTDVEYSEDGRFVTLYLDGSAPVPSNRALNKYIAQLGYNFFEVTFCYNDSGTYRIIRASWELGEPAGVTGVTREVNYYGTNPVGLPDSGQGSVVLFVGERSDKTLLAVGTLSYIDNTPIATSGIITLSTTKVTFELNALKAGVSAAVAGSSFKTISPAPPGTLSNIPGKIGGVDFPYFPVPADASITASYTFGFDAAAHGYSFYQPAIIYAGGATAIIIRPEWTFPPNTKKTDSIYPFSNAVTETTRVAVTYPSTVGNAFDGTMLLTISTAGEPSPAIAALTLRVPVLAVRNTDNPVSWFIKPGFGSYHMELDNGKYENGGAVLLGIGVTGGTVAAGIEVKGTPQKYYPGSMTFTLEGLQVLFRESEVLVTDITPSSPFGVNIGGNTEGVYFYYDDNGPPYDNYADAVTPMVANSGGNFVWPSKFAGYKVLIKVEYVTSSGVHYTSFLVEVNDVPYADIPYQHRVFLAKADDFTQVSNRVTNEGGGYWLFIFTENVNIRDMTFNAAAQTVIFMVATRENIVIGRDGSSRISNNGSGQMTINIGSWPFNEPAFAGGDVITNYFFEINAGGTWGNASGGATVSNTMFRTGNLTVNIISDITVRNSTWLGPGP